MGNRLPRKTKIYPIYFDKLELKEEEQVCCICYEKFYENHVTLPCKHHFHENCIMKWFNQNYNCPLCREKVSLKLINVISDQD